jgi:hypothetical protein
MLMNILVMCLTILIRVIFILRASRTTDLVIWWTWASIRVHNAVFGCRTITAAVALAKRGTSSVVRTRAGWNCKSLVDDITNKNFDRSSHRIIACLGGLEKEDRRYMLMRIAGMILRKAKVKPTRADTCARLCWEIYRNISKDVIDDTVGCQEGKPLSDGQLFRECLLNGCQNGIERKQKDTVSSFGIDIT